MHKGILVVCAASILTALAAYSDEVVFKSGDRLTGTVKSVSDGKMVFDSKVAGEITLKMSEIETFTTDGPIEIVKADGSAATLKVSASEGGNVSVTPEGAAQPQTLALAEMAKINPDKPAWHGSVMGGMTWVRGNTKSVAANIDADAKLRREKDRITLGAGYYFAKQRDNDTRRDSTTLDNWFAKGQYDYFLSEKAYLLGSLMYEKDRIAHLDRRFTASVGLGYQWVEKDDFKFATEAGIASVSERYTDPSDDEHNMALRLAYHLEKDFNERVKGFHNAEYLPSLEDADIFLANVDIGLRAAITARLSMETKAQLAFNSQPASGRDKKDTRYIVGVGWVF